MTATASPLPRYTPQQKLAIETRDVAVALSAGAGCGKTFVLTHRFLSHLAPGPDCVPLSQLVAITFTDKAAREMRDRIRSACHQRLLNCPAEEVDHWLGIARDVDSARISTIHAFCASLLRSHAVAAHLDPGFGVLEPAVAGSLLRDSVRDVVFECLEENHPDALELVYRFGLERLRTLLEKLVVQRFRAEVALLSQVSAQTWQERWRSLWEQEIQPLLLAEFRQSPQLLALKELLPDAHPDHKEMKRRCDALRNWLDPETEWADPLVAATTMAELALVQGGGGAKVWDTPELYEQVKTVFAAFRKEAKTFAEDYRFPDEDLELSADVTCRFCRLTGLATDRYEETKRQAGLLDFDDLLLRARNLLRDIPAVRHQMERGLQLLMVDEFQDTDPVQAELVRHLCGDALLHGKLFLVGDAKQSIYRFRRADPQVFEALRNSIPERGQLPLNCNFRSRKAVLDFVNLLFSQAMGAQYEALVAADQTVYETPPAIEFLWAFEPASGVEAAADTVEADENSAGAKRKREADWIARRIAQMLADPTPRVRDRSASGGLRRIEQGDICLLFRAMTNVQDYESALRDYGLDYYLVGGKAFYAQQEVYDVLNLCQVLIEADDDVSLLGVLRSPFFNLSDDTLHALSRQKGAWWTRIASEPPPHLSEEDRRRLQFAAQTLAELRQLRDIVPIRELLETAIRKTGYDAALLLEFLGPRKVANLRKLLTMAEEFDAAELFTLRDFVLRVHSAIQDETDEELAATELESGQVIRLMTIHQSKGLEFPVVIIADLDRAKSAHGGGAVLDADLGAITTLPARFGQTYRHAGYELHKIRERVADAAESIRMLYVAVTRAADVLILSAGLPTNREWSSAWMSLIASRLNPLTGLPMGDPLLGTLIGVSDVSDIPAILAHHAPPVPPPSSTISETKPTLPWHTVSEWVLTAEPAEWPLGAVTYPADQTDPLWASPSALEAVVDPLTDQQTALISPDADQATELGTLIHDILEFVDFQNPDSWRQQWEIQRARRSEEFDATIFQTAAVLLEQFAQSPVWQEIAESRQIFRETEFALRWPLTAEVTTSAAIITGRYDLLAQRADGQWWILDYKTGQAAKGATDEQLCAPYLLQLGIYALALEQALQQPVERIGLILFRPHVRVAEFNWSAQQENVLSELESSLRTLKTAMRGGAAVRTIVTSP